MLTGPFVTLKMKKTITNCNSVGVKTTQDLVPKRLPNRCDSGQTSEIMPKGTRVHSHGDVYSNHPKRWIPSWRVTSPFLLDPRRLHVFLCNWPWWSVPVHESQRRLLLGSRSGQCGPWPRSSSTVDMSMYLLPLAMPVLFVHKIVWPDRHDTWSRVHLQARAVSSMRGT